MKKVIIFDIGNVIARVENNVYFSDIIKKYNAADNFCDIIANDSMWLELDKGTISYEEGRIYYKNKYPNFNNLIDYLFDNWPKGMIVDDYAIETIKMLKKTGHKIYFLSNINKYCLDYVLKKYSFIQMGDGYIASCDCHINKPNEKIYDLLFEKFKLIPSDCIYLDDNVDNILIGHDKGMQTILVKNIKDAMNELKEKVND